MRVIRGRPTCGRNGSEHNEREGMMKKWVIKGEKALAGLRRTSCAWMVRGRRKLLDAKGQGTTEYAILVGVLVVIAIVAITLFKPKIQELWDAIAQGLQGL